jgi:carboxyl-terminal processing protease
MENRGSLGALIATAVWTALVFTGGWALGAFVWNPNGPQLLAPMPPGALAGATTTPSPRRGRLFEEAWGRVTDNFVGVVPTDTVREYGAVRGALNTLGDRYTYFVEPKAHAVERDHMRGQFGGIGVTFVVNDQGKVVLTPLKDGAAARAGVQDKDLLLTIDGVPVPERATLEDVAKIRGEVGVKVAIVVQRGDKQLEFNIVRELIQVASVEWRLIDKNGVKIGLIQIRQFTERTGKETKQAINELNAAGATRWVLDLRDNGGGLLSSAIEVAGEFLREGVVLHERKRDKPESSYAVQDSAADSKPLVVLINRNSASASEVVAGALRDHKRARLVGEKSFGKGSVQLIFDLSDGSSVHVTHAKWLTPNYTEIDGVGLIPDVLYTRPEGEARSGADTQLDKAIELVAVQ